jgi:pyrroloquinoline quinone biosynthesis protein D
VTSNFDRLDTPRRRASIQVVDRGADAKLVDASGRPILGLNDTALAIWDLCDGDTTVEEMFQAVVSAFPVEPDRAAADVAAVVAEFDRMNCLDHAPSGN